MIGGFVVLLISGLLSFLIIDRLKEKYPFIDSKFLKTLFFYHTLLSLAYYVYAVFNPSDSKFYYEKILINYRGDDWSSFYGTSTTFIEFFGYPFIKYFGFSYEAIMALFSFLGFLGFVYFYIVFKENIRFKHTFFGFDLLKLIFFLPNLHFWSASFGKGSIIFFAIGLFFFGLNRLQARWLSVILGGVLTYHVRPHIMLVLLVSASLGFMFTTRGMSLSIRLLFLFGAMVAFYYIYGDVLTLVGISENEFATQSFDLTHRATELSKATSGIEITSYSLPFQVFTFLYRPLFIDAPGALGVIVSFENVFYILISFKLLSLRGVKYLITGNFLVKTALFSFVTVTIALAQISGNLGLAIRQKSQVMVLFLFVILSFLDAQKLSAYRSAIIKRIRKMKRDHAESNVV